jgi:hypothetical protein
MGSPRCNIGTRRVGRREGAKIALHCFCSVTRIFVGLCLVRAVSIGVLGMYSRRAVGLPEATAIFIEAFYMD